MRAVATLGAAIFVFAAAGALGQTCTVSSVSVCGPDGCRDAPNTIRLALTPDGVRRCDSRGCDQVVTSNFTSGAFEVRANPEAGYFLKRSSAEGSFVEVATLGTVAYVTSGVCR